ncbi:hypothetical protein Tco_0729495 [Tanacetum coccineum]|uniref:DUF8040 domain-containing protein n=1 Tax=Tanacetum coccineum TaxID=301880 RepID=A0ABQ4YP10_9ASTR
MTDFVPPLHVYVVPHQSVIMVLDDNGEVLCKKDVYVGLCGFSLVHGDAKVTQSERLQEMALKEYQKLLSSRKRAGESCTCKLEVTVAGMENVGESSKQKKPRLNWKKESVVKTFLEACIHEVAVNGRDRKPVRSTGLLFPDLCTQLFDGSTSNGFEGWGPASNLSNDCEDSVNVVSLEDDYIQHVQAILASTQEPPNSTQECSGPQTKRGDYIDACMEKLENVGWGTHNPLYEVAVMLYSESVDYRKVWMRLKPESLENRVRNAGHNERFRMVKRRFQHSTQTIHECFHEVLRGMMQFSREVIVPTSLEENTSERHRNLREIFTGEISGLNGTLIHAVVPVDQQIRYRGRGKGECFQNVLGICNFNMTVMFVWAGWEVIAHDSKVLTEITFNPNSNFPFPPPSTYYPRIT